MRKKLASLPVVKFLTSIRITVTCLAFLFILTLGGTIYQVSHGLYLAQQKYFNSFFFLLSDVIPFPGAQLVMWVLFVNLMAVLFFRFVYKRSYIGILVIHIGILMFLLSAFVVHYDSVESHLTLMENEGSNVSADYNEWELAVWKKEGDTRKVVAYDVRQFAPGKTVSFGMFGFDLAVKSYHPNCMPFSDSPHSTAAEAVNASGIQVLKETDVQLDPTRNIPGGVFMLARGDTAEKNILLFGGETKATSLVVDGEPYYFMLRHKHYPLPFVLTLLDFRMQKHPGTDIAKSYESLVELKTPELSRQTVIFMNNPLRYKDYTLYQSSYSVDQSGRESSTLAVVKNKGRLLPYIATFTTFFGLLLHFILVFFASLKKRPS